MRGFMMGIGVYLLFKAAQLAPKDSMPSTKVWALVIIGTALVLY